MSDYAITVSVCIVFVAGFAYGWLFGASPSPWYIDFPLIALAFGTMVLLARRYGRPPTGAERQQ